MQRARPPDQPGMQHQRQTDRDATSTGAVHDQPAEPVDFYRRV